MALLLMTLLLMNLLLILPWSIPMLTKDPKKKLEFDTPTPEVTKSTKRKSKRKITVVKKKRKTSFLLQRDILEIALAGDPGPLQEYIDNFDMDRA